MKINDKQINTLHDLQNFVTITEYAKACNVVRNTIHTRIKSPRNPLPTIEVAPSVLYEFLEKRQEEVKADRPLLWKAALDYASKGKKKALLINKEEHPPKRRKIGRPTVNRELGSAAKRAAKFAAARGFTFKRVGYGYRVSQNGTEIAFKNLASFYKDIRKHPLLEKEED